MVVRSIAAAYRAARGGRHEGSSRLGHVATSDRVSRGAAGAPDRRATATTRRRRARPGRPGPPDRPAPGRGQRSARPGRPRRRRPRRGRRRPGPGEPGQTVVEGAHGGEPSARAEGPRWRGDGESWRAFRRRSGRRWAGSPAAAPPLHRAYQRPPAIRAARSHRSTRRRCLEATARRPRAASPRPRKPLSVDGGGARSGPGPAGPAPAHRQRANPSSIHQPPPRWAAAAAARGSSYLGSA
jgi:hypothetical protein